MEITEKKVFEHHIAVEITEEEMREAVWAFICHKADLDIPFGSCEITIGSSTYGDSTGADLKAVISRPGEDLDK